MVSFFFARRFFILGNWYKDGETWFLFPSREGFFFWEIGKSMVKRGETWFLFPSREGFLFWEIGTRMVKHGFFFLHEKVFYFWEDFVCLKCNNVSMV